MGSSYNPDPTTVAVDAVPIVVESTTDGYLVLHVKHEVGVSGLPLAEVPGEPVHTEGNKGGRRDDSALHT